MMLDEPGFAALSISGALEVLTRSFAVACIH
jgi:hypothetical protein